MIEHIMPVQRSDTSWSGTQLPWKRQETCAVWRSPAQR